MCVTQRKDVRADKSSPTKTSISLEVAAAASTPQQRSMPGRKESLSNWFLLRFLNPSIVLKVMMDPCVRTTSFLMEEAIPMDSWSSRMRGGSAVDPFVGATPKDPPIVTGSSLNFKTSSFCSPCANQNEDSTVDANGTNFTTTGVVPSDNDMACSVFF
eukprot:scaffold103442_cov52-Attheya_sp.AAC.1